METERDVFLIQSLAGYDGHYAAKAKKLRDAGYICCRSELAYSCAQHGEVSADHKCAVFTQPGPEDKPKYWEVWLGWPFRLKESREETLEWLMKMIRPGEIWVAVTDQRWGLSID